MDKLIAFLINIIYARYLPIQMVSHLCKKTVRTGNRHKQVIIWSAFPFLMVKTAVLNSHKMCPTSYRFVMGLMPVAVTNKGCLTYGRCGSFSA